MRSRALLIRCRHRSLLLLWLRQSPPRPVHKSQPGDRRRSCLERRRIRRAMMERGAPRAARLVIIDALADGAGRIWRDGLGSDCAMLRIGVGAAGAVPSAAWPVGTLGVRSFLGFFLLLITLLLKFTVF